ncbi:hypothetical protein ACFX2I_013271 [Malus domestica]
MNQLLQCTEMQRALDEVSQSRTRAKEKTFQRRPSKQPLDQPQTECSGNVHSQLGPQDSVYSYLIMGRSVHSQLGLRMSIQSRLGPHSDSQHEQPSRQNVHSRLGP